MLAYSLAALNLTLAVAALLIARRRQRSITRLNTLLIIAQYDATHDDLTGLLNRRAILAHLGSQLATRQPVTIALLDLDGFKGINDAHGHHAGDAALIEAARRLNALPVTIGRLGGDEFLMVVAADEQTGFAHATAAQAALASARIDTAGRTIQLSATAGVAHATANVSAPELLRRADRALYAAKRTGEPIETHHHDIPDMPTPDPQRRRRTYR
ncbi:GGDEF domain-containing protein [Micromonospora echinofusca]|uniref:GGDEF domain-containing protein n=1 Tax=Micromonospora echinofusca TaxID=47858 RepID=UPI0037AFC8CA